MPVTPVLAMMGFAALYPSYEKNRRPRGAADRFFPPIVSIGWPRLARRAGVLEDRAEHFPTLTVEPHHLQLLVDAVIGWRGIGEDTRQRQIEHDVLEAGRLLHDVFAGEIIAALLEHMDHQLRGRVGIGIEARVLVAVGIVFRHELEILL